LDIGFFIKEAQKKIKLTLKFKNYNSKQGIYGIQPKSSILTHALRKNICDKCFQVFYL
uniref:Uncharacterized protein n=1 Tax=Amphimedon queenslandica TaxID=400682 RepID=A0A1X7V781_AMPQE